MDHHRAVNEHSCMTEAQANRVPLFRIQSTRQRETANLMCASRPGGVSGFNGHLEKLVALGVLSKKGQAPVLIDKPLHRGVHQELSLYGLPLRMLGDTVDIRCRLMQHHENDLAGRKTDISHITSWQTL